MRSSERRRVVAETVVQESGLGVASGRSSSSQTERLEHAKCRTDSALAAQQRCEERDRHRLIDIYSDCTLCFLWLCQSAINKKCLNM
jgi:hypothetical protein